MTGSEIALVITAAGTLVTAIGGVVVAVITRKNQVATREVHTMVNQQRTDALRYQNALVLALKTAGIAVPDDQSLTLTNQEGKKIDG